MNQPNGRVPAATATRNVRIAANGSAANGPKVDPKDPQVRKLVYNMYRGMLDKKHERANVILDAAPQDLVSKDQGVSSRVESMMRQQNELKGGNMNAGGPPPPPPPPPIPGITQTNRLPSETPGRSPTMNLPPAALAGAMMKDKKPFTYTPGGLDLSEIKSPRMARRIQRNAQSEGVRPSPLAAQPSPNAATSGASSPAPLGMPIQVLPLPGMKMGPQQQQQAAPPQPKEPPPKPKSVCGPAPPPPPFQVNANSSYSPPVVSPPVVTSPLAFPATPPSVPEPQLAKEPGPSIPVAPPMPPPGPAARRGSMLIASPPSSPLVSSGSSDVMSPPPLPPPQPVKVPITPPIMPMPVKSPSPPPKETKVEPPFIPSPAPAKTEPISAIAPEQEKEKLPVINHTAPAAVPNLGRRASLTELAPMMIKEPSPVPQSIKEPSPVPQSPILGPSTPLSPIQDPYVPFSPIKEPFSPPQTPLRDPSPLRQTSVKEPSPLPQLPLKEPSPLLQTSMKDPSPLRQVSSKEPSPLRQFSVKDPSPLLLNSMEDPSSLLQNSVKEPSPLRQFSVKDQSPLRQTHSKDPSSVRQVPFKEFSPLPQTPIKEPSPMRYELTPPKTIPITQNNSKQVPPREKTPEFRKETVARRNSIIESQMDQLDSDSSMIFSPPSVKQMPSREPTPVRHIVREPTPVKQAVLQYPVAESPVAKQPAQPTPPLVKAPTQTPTPIESSANGPSQSKTAPAAQGTIKRQSILPDPMQINYIPIEKTAVINAQPSLSQPTMKIAPNVSKQPHTIKTPVQMPSSSPVSSAAAAPSTPSSKAAPMPLNKAASAPLNMSASAPSSKAAPLNMSASAPTNKAAPVPLNMAAPAPLNMSASAHSSKAAPASLNVAASSPSNMAAPAPLNMGAQAPTNSAVGAISSSTLPSKAKQQLSRQNSLPAKPANQAAPQAAPVSSDEDTSASPMSPSSDAWSSPTTGLQKAPLPWMTGKPKETTPPPLFVTRAHQTQNRLQKRLVRQHSVGPEPSRAQPLAQATVTSHPEVHQHPGFQRQSSLPPPQRQTQQMPQPQPIRIQPIQTQPQPQQTQVRNIPIKVQPQQQPQQPQQPQHRPRERIIPITIERNSPPRTTAPTSVPINTPQTSAHERIIPVQFEGAVSSTPKPGLQRPTAQAQQKPQSQAQQPQSWANSPGAAFSPPQFPSTPLSGNQSGAFLPYNSPAGLYSNNNALDALHQMQQSLEQLNSGLQNAFPRFIQKKMSDSITSRKQPSTQQNGGDATNGGDFAPVQSRSFRVLQNVLDHDTAETQGPVHIPKVNPQPKMQQIPPPQLYQQPDGLNATAPSDQTVPEPKKYMGGNIPSRSFRMLQAMTDADDVLGPGLSDL